MLPETFCDLKRIDLQIAPPGSLIVGLVQLSVMAAAQRYGELITHLETDRPRLREPQVVGIGRLPAANQARLGGNKFQVCLVAQALGLGDGELALSILPLRKAGAAGARGGAAALSSPAFAWS